MRLVNLCGIAVLATFVIAGAAMPGSNRSAAVARSAGNAVVSYTSERALRQALERHPAQVVRRIPALGVAEVRPAGDAATFALELAREPGITHVEQTSTRHSRAEPSLASLPGDRIPVAVRRDARRPGSGSGDTRGCRNHDRRDRHRRGSGSSGPRREGAADLQREDEARRREGLERPRHLRRLARSRLDLERRRSCGQLGRSPADGDPGGRPAGRRSPTSTRQPRSSTPSITARGSSISASGARRPLRSSAARSTTPLPGRTARCGGGQQPPRREPGRVSGCAAPARRLTRDRRARPLGRRLDPVRRPRTVLQHRYAHLPGRAR